MILYCAAAALLAYYLIKRCVLERISIGAEGKWVFITGCDSGFGRLTVLRLIDRGTTVFAGCYTEKGRKSLEASAVEKQCSARLHVFHLDISSDESVNESYDFVQRILIANDAQLWGLINNAGIFSVFGPADWCSVKQYRDSLEVNCLGTVRMCQRFLPLLKQSKGRIVTTASTAGRLHGQFLAPYCTSKFAVRAYMDCLRFELRNFGVSVHILEPGAFKTELLNAESLNARVENIWSHLSDDVKEDYGEEYKDNFKQSWNSGVGFAASTNLQWVVDHYEHALFSFWPRLRYHAGWDAIILFVPLSMMPSWWQDCFLSLLYKLQPGPSLIPQSLKPNECLLPK